MSKVASSTLGYRTVIEVGIATVVGAAEKDDKGANWCDLLLNGSGRFGWFTKGAQVMGIGETRKWRASAEKIYSYLAIRMFVGWLQPLTWTLPRGPTVAACPASTGETLPSRYAKARMDLRERNASVQLVYHLHARHKGREFRCSRLNAPCRSLTWRLSGDLCHNNATVIRKDLRNFLVSLARHLQHACVAGNRRRGWSSTSFKQTTYHASGREVKRSDFDRRYELAMHLKCTQCTLD
jgi:hypothetical protein